MADLSLISRRLLFGLLGATAVAPLAPKRPPAPAGLAYLSEASLEAFRRDAALVAFQGRWFIAKGGKIFYSRGESAIDRGGW